MKFVEAALIGGVGLAVLFFGGTEPVSFGAVEILFFGAAAWLALKADAASIPSRRSYLLIPALLLVVPLLQLMPLPQGVRALLEVNRGSDPRAPVSMAPYDTRFELLILLACVIAFFLALAVSGHRDGKRKLVHALVVIGAGEAFYGLIQYLANWQNIFWYAKKYDIEEATGTYINRNHFAGLLEMTLPFAVCLALYEGEKFFFSRATHPRRASKLNPSKTALWVAIAVVMMASLVFSRSRMGLLATGASLLILVTLHGLQRKAVPLVITATFLILSFGLAAWIGLRPALNRFESLGQEFAGDETRLSIWPATLKMIRQSPIVGNGLGSFPIAYTRFQTTFLTKFMNHSHNDYLELANDLGIPLGAALFASILLVAFKSLKTFLNTNSRFDRNISLACLGSIVAISLHSLSDFNLYIPANALVLATILGIAVATNSGASIAEAAG